MVLTVVCEQRNHSLFGAVRTLQNAQKNALLSNGLRNALPPGVPRLHIPDSSSSEKTEGSDELPTHVPAGYKRL